MKSDEDVRVSQNNSHFTAKLLKTHILILQQLFKALYR